ncbi:MAG: 30S ribosomal protein S4e [Candidatus Aenigmarchaeota archaeon]|nr:30S ribosomal protein S4e [Candidatus Aenigmarchaeota archaeon]
MKLKRMSAPRWWPIERKTSKFVIAVRGSHSKEFSLPLLVLVRDVLKIAETNTEARKIIKEGHVLVDKKKRKDPRYGVGLFDVIEIPLMKKFWRAVPNNGISFIEIPESESKIKICKIVDKKTLKGNKNQLNLADGRNILADKKYSTLDSIVLELPEQKIVDHLKFEKGSTVLVVKGRNAGKMAKIKTIEKERLWLDNGELFEIPKNLVVVVGKDAPIIKLE